MIQITAPTLNASALPIVGGAAFSAVPGMPGADFAALLGLPSAPITAAGGIADAGAEPSTVSAQPEALGDFVKDTQQGLAALALQAGAAAPRPVGTAIPTGFDLAAPIAQGSAQTRAAAPGPGNPAPPATTHIPSSVAFPPQGAATPAIPAAGITQAAPVATVPGELPILSLDQQPLAVFLPARTGASCDIPVDGKNGKMSGKILPSAGMPPRQKPAAADTAEIAAEPQATEHVPAAAGTAIPLLTDVMPVPALTVPLASQPAAPATLAQPPAAVPMVAVSPRLQPRPGDVVPALPRNAEVTGIAPPPTGDLTQMRAVRFEAIEIVSVDAGEAVPIRVAPFPPPPVAPIAAPVIPGAKAQSPTLRFQTDRPASTPNPAVTGASPPVARALHSLADAAQPMGTVRAAAADGTAGEPALTVKVQPPLTAPDQRLAINQTPTLARAEPSGGPAPQQQTAALPNVAAPTAHDLGGQALVAEPRAEPSVTPVREAPTKGAIDPGKASEADIAPITASPHPSAPPAIAESMPTAPSVAADETSVSSPVPSETPHDFDTLVSRLAEAREAASPNLVRTAMAHGEFGRVSMQLDHSEGGLSVTLASRDPEFTGAVQAAAAAMNSNGSANSEQPRQDGSVPHQNGAQNQAQAQSGPPAGTGNPGQGQQSRREAGNFTRQQGQQQTDTPGRSRGEQRPGSGVYA